MYVLQELRWKKNNEVSGGTECQFRLCTQKGNQMTRSEVREHIFRILFSVEFCEKGEFEEQVTLYFQGHEGIKEKQQREILTKVTDLIDHLNQLDEEIASHAKAWSLSRLGKSELSILRLAAYEILFDQQVPKKVAINEAVELTKKYCNEKAAPFVNGILGKIGTTDE